MSNKIPKINIFNNFEIFKEFISKGNVMDLAVGVIIGGAFKAIVDSLVNDMIMPIITMITGKVDLSGVSVQIGSATLSYGKFISAIINFLIIAIVIFLMIKSINKAQNMTSKIVKKSNEGEEEAEPEEKVCPYCLSNIPYHATKCKYCASDFEEDK